MDNRKIPLFCYWNGCIKDGHDGPFYQGSSPRVIRVERKIELHKLLDDLHRVTGFEKGKFQIDLIGRYPSLVQPPTIQYVRLPIVDDSSLETMLEVPSDHRSINNLELYLEVKPVSGGASSLANQARRKRSRDKDADTDVSVRDNALRTPRGGNNNGWIEDEESTDAGNCGNGENNESVQKKSNVIFSSSLLDEHELHVGMIFRDRGEFVKAVKLYSGRRQRKYMDWAFSRSWFHGLCGGQGKCPWTLRAEERKGIGYVITYYKGPHTCEPVDVSLDFLAREIECLISAQPSLSIAVLIKWLKEEFGYAVSHSCMWDAKMKATTAMSGDLDKSFSILPKFMTALCSSNKMLMDWQYELLPDGKGASFRSVFWAFQQSVEGFLRLRPLIIVDSVDLIGKYPGKVLVAAGLDAENQLFPLAFAIVTRESFSADTWRWFFACIRKKVTQREDLCLITSLDSDVVAVVNEPECQWAQHRFCLRHFCFKFCDVFHNNFMTEFVYKAGSTSSVSSFDYYLKKIEEINPNARKWLNEIPLHQWALAHDDGGLRFGITNTNLIFKVYGFISNIRDLPITTCILLIFDHLAELFSSQRVLRDESSLNREDKYAKHVTEKLEEYKVACTKLDVLPLDQLRERFQVTEVMRLGNKRYVTHFGDRVCSCGIWQLYKYPCSHALAVFKRLNVDHLMFVNDFYNTERSREVYAAEFHPLPRVSDWPEAPEFPKLFPPGRAQGEPEPNRTKL